VRVERNFLDCASFREFMAVVLEGVENCGRWAKSTPKFKIENLKLKFEISVLVIFIGFGGFGLAVVVQSIRLFLAVFNLFC